MGLAIACLMIYSLSYGFVNKKEWLSAIWTLLMYMEKGLPDVVKDLLDAAALLLYTACISMAILGKLFN